MRKRRLIRIGLAVLAAALVAALLHLPTVVSIGPGYTAELTCACLFVSGRPAASCRGDLDPIARALVSVAIDPAARSVAASWTPAGLLRRTARYREGDGCGLAAP